MALIRVYRRAPGKSYIPVKLILDYDFSLGVACMAKLRVQTDQSVG